MLGLRPGSVTLCIVPSAASDARSVSAVEDVPYSTSVSATSLVAQVMPALACDGVTTRLQSPAPWCQSSRSTIAGVASTAPDGAVALTEKLWLPAARAEYAIGLVHAA